MSPDPTAPFQHALITGLTYLFSAFLPFLQRQSQLYWPFLVSTLAVALLYWRLAREGGARLSWREFRRRYFGRELWWHPSARADYRYYVVNAAVYPLVAGPALLTGTAIATGLHGALQPLLGTPRPDAGGGMGDDAALHRHLLRRLRFRPLRRAFGAA